MPHRTIQCSTIQEAMKHVNALIREASVLNWNILQAPVGRYLNPGDVYDAYELIQKSPCTEEILESERCGPFVAIALQNLGDEAIAQWEDYVTTEYDPRYRAGFMNGFQLIVPEPLEDWFNETHYLRGTYDGVMAHAAVF